MAWSRVFICLSLFNFALKFAVMDLTWGVQQSLLDKDSQKWVEECNVKAVDCFK